MMLAVIAVNRSYLWLGKLIGFGTFPKTVNFLVGARLLKNKTT